MYVQSSAATREIQFICVSGMDDEIRPNKKHAMFPIAHVHCDYQIACSFFFLMMCVFTNHLSAEKDATK